MAKDPLNNSFLFRYSLLALPLAFIGLPLYINLPKYYAENYGVSLASIGLILLLLRIGDAVIDPLIGILSDRNARIRRKVIGISAICVPFFFAMLFLLPKTSLKALPEIWFAVNTALVYFFFSIIYINYYGIGLSVTSNYNQRTKLSAFREGGTLIGVLIAAILPKALSSVIISNYIFLVYAGLLAALLLIAFLLLPKVETPIIERKSRKFPLKEILAIPQMGWLLAIFLSTPYQPQ